MMSTIDRLPDWTLWLAAMTVAVGIVIRQAIMPLIRWVARAERWAARVEESLTYVRKEMEFNGGTTARDAIQRLEDAVGNLLKHDADRIAVDRRRDTTETTD